VSKVIGQFYHFIAFDDNIVKLFQTDPIPIGEIEHKVKELRGRLE